jgi:hypothetical protein
MRGKYRQIFLRVSADGEETTQSRFTQIGSTLWHSHQMANTLSQVLGIEHATLLNCFFSFIASYTYIGMNGSMLSSSQIQIRSSAQERVPQP